MRRMTCFVMALALVLGLAQCKKEQTNNQNAESHLVPITLNVNGGNNSRAVVNPTGAEDYATVTFEDGDVIYVGYNNAYVGTLTYSNNTFSGSVNIDNYDGEKPLHFYFLGGVGFTPTIDETNNTATVVISDQSSKYPVISYSPSNEPFAGEGAYSAKLQNKVSIMKFNVTTPSTASICITGMNNKVTVDFTAPSGTDNGFTYSKDGEGVIKMHGVTTDNTVTWAIVLPQLALDEQGGAYSEDGAFTGTRGNVPAITENGYLTEGIAVNITNHGYVDLDLPSGTLWAICNIGANSPTAYGDYLAWGETEPKTPWSYDWDTYMFYFGGKLTKYCNDANYGDTDGLTTLDSDDDVAMYNWRSGWRMPTKADFEELFNNTTVTWTQQGGVNGRLFTATNGNSIFLPAAGYREGNNLSSDGSYGYYWSSMLYTDYPHYAWQFHFGSSDSNVGSSERCYGLSVRPVRSATRN